MAYEALAKVYDSYMKDVRYGDWTSYVASILEVRGVKPPMSILDCGCGTGVATLLLKKRGFDIIGIDRSTEMLDIAAQRARDAGKAIRYLNMNMTQIALHKPVNAIISMCDGVNYLDDLKSAACFFALAYSSLAQGGVLAFDISSRYKLENIIGCRTFAEQDEDSAYIWENDFDPRSRILSIYLTVFYRDGDAFKRKREFQTQRAHEVDELTLALNNAGFTDISVYDAFTNCAWNNTSERIQFVAVKGG